MKEDNILQKIIESCEEFEKKPVTGNYKWNVGRCTDYSTRTNIGLVKFWLLDSGYFYFRISDANNVKLTATTAREAAHEALQLVKNEAQKLVDALSEPKEPLFIPVNENDLYFFRCMAFNDTDCMEGFLEQRKDGIWCKNGDDSIANITHYIPSKQLHNDFKNRKQ